LNPREFVPFPVSFEVVEKAVQECFQLEVSDEAIRHVAEEVGQPAWSWILEIDGKKVGLQDGYWQQVNIGVIYQLSDEV